MLRALLKGAYSKGVGFEGRLCFRGGCIGKRRRPRFPCRRTGSPRFIKAHAHLRGGTLFMQHGNIRLRILPFVCSCVSFLFYVNAGRYIRSHCQIIIQKILLQIDESDSIAIGSNPLKVNSVRLVFVVNFQASGFFPRIFVLLQE